jgi:hypothetical protein
VTLRRLAPLLVLAGVVAVVHGRAIGFGFTSLDDLTLLVDDQTFLAARGALWRAFARGYFHVVDAAHAYYRPIVTASYALDTQAFSASPRGYHATNVVLHLLASWLVRALLVRAHIRAGVALAAAVVFAIHPALVPVVAWIPGRNDSLLAVFTLATILAYAKARAGGNAHTWAWRVAAIVSFGLAMFTKETAIVVPILCVAWERLVERGETTLPRTAPERAWVWIGWACVTAGYAYARWRVVLGPSSPRDVHALLERSRAFLSGASDLGVPLQPAPIATLADGSVWPGIAVVLLLTMLVVRRRATLHLGVIAFGVILYALPLVPTLFSGGTLALENRLYLPCVGFVLVLAELLDKTPFERRIGIAFGSVAVFVLAVLTIGYAGAFRDPLSFGKAAVAGAPHSALAHFALGQARHLRGDIDGAESEYRAALALDPSEPIVHNNLAVIFMRRQEWARAESELEAELRLNPSYATAEGNLAIVRRKLDR